MFHQHWLTAKQQLKHCPLTVSYDLINAICRLSPQSPGLSASNSEVIITILFLYFFYDSEISAYFGDNMTPQNASTLYWYYMSYTNRVVSVQMWIILNKLFQPNDLPWCKTRLARANTSYIRGVHCIVGKRLAGEEANMAALIRPSSRVLKVT